MKEQEDVSGCCVDLESCGQAAVKHFRFALG
jgi:hypothetical protein